MDTQLAGHPICVWGVYPIRHGELTQVKMGCCRIDGRAPAGYAVGIKRLEFVNREP
ncbi:MAG TPA: hypothetical protein PLD25_18765 [Chloroflexota bacterium]|nr:hypothetical protein [Chloroflexota bacterium]